MPANQHFPVQSTIRGYMDDKNQSCAKTPPMSNTAVHSAKPFQTINMGSKEIDVGKAVKQNIMLLAGDKQKKDNAIFTFP